MNNSNNKSEQLPIAEFKNGFTLEQSKQFRNNRELSSWLGGGDASVWVNLKATEAFPSTAYVPNRKAVKELPKEINPEIGKLVTETNNLGEISLDDFMVHPDSRAQAFMVIHKGKIVYENYPAMQPTDSHIWMSTAKVLPSLIIDLLIAEGKMDESKTVGEYLPVFKDTAWENISVLDVLDMTTGLNIEELQNGTWYAPGSIAQRMLSAEFGLPYEGKVEDFTEVLKDAKKVREAGEQYDYSSVATQVLVLLAESVTGERWAQTVDKRIWSKMGVEAPLLVHTTPDGIAMGHGMLSSRLTDFARFGMLYTPSWNKVTDEKIVSDNILKRIQTGTRNLDFFMKGSGPLRVSQLNDDTMIGSSRQWDSVWTDGDLFKSGFQQQGLYVSPKRDLVIVHFSVNGPDDSIKHFLRPLATSGLFD
ncbi:serine hydrolase domain-containing protein [Sediminitomix flava]|uniref:CubicO group peptidase (Beta-lactamase class C family) n=1 Tax=Sediminitomix flava TaxID=379075 RepID=A0A315Z733_SEDFL|nr:serine hydrolase [Sediminitomix flava]PWJ38575.1 CubicO group peptidase (beta-lactamase class C family) [Sediminitomix flava]